MKRKILVPVFASFMALSMNGIAHADDAKVEKATDKKDVNEKNVINLKDYKDVDFKVAEVKDGVAVKVRKQGSVQTIAYTGDQFKIVGEQDGWYKVQLDDETEGWIASRYVDVKAANAYITADKVNLRKDAHVESDVKDNLPASTKVQVLGTEGNWVKVKNGENEGFVRDLYVSDKAPVVEEEKTQSDVKDQNDGQVSDNNQTTNNDATNENESNNVENNNDNNNNNNDAVEDNNDNSTTNNDNNNNSNNNVDNDENNNDNNNNNNNDNNSNVDNNDNTNSNNNNNNNNNNNTNTDNSGKVVMPSGVIVEGIIKYMGVDDNNIVVTIEDTKGNILSFSNKSNNIVVALDGKQAYPENIKTGYEVKLYTDGTTVKGIEAESETDVNKTVYGEILLVKSSSIRI